METDFTEEQLEDIKQIFQHFNKNNDGKLSNMELRIMLRSFAKNPTEAELQDLVKEIDLMGSGSIDYQDFLSLVSKSMKQECSDEEYAAVFRVYDSDGNGVITFDEFREAMKSMGENLSKLEAEEMIVEADSDGDGQIDLKEFIAMMRER